ncbi:MAG: hypothetical protein IJW49_08050 [Clostridia bacterium]|nr:hypothetical protein [Clostridia bacterium]
MNVSYHHESIRLTGRWDTTGPAAVTTTTGAYIEFAFEGDMALFRFDITANATPYLHLWIQLDGGDLYEAPIDAYLRVCAKTYGKHICRVIYKGGSEKDRRWYAPLTGKVSFVGAQAEKPLPIGEDPRPIIEFVGDSITEGVLIDMDFEAEDDPIFTYVGEKHRCYQDDVCATYAWRTAEALNLRPFVMGYGAVGVTRAGCGMVPPAPDAYPFNFDGSPITHAGKPRYILINHGANDRKNKDTYLLCYIRLLDTIRELNPQATLIVLSPFCGFFQEELAATVKAYREKTGCDIHFINGGNWIPAEPLHPWRDGHKTVAENLVRELGKIING